MIFLTPNIFSLFRIVGGSLNQLEFTRQVTVALLKADPTPNPVSLALGPDSRTRVCEEMRFDSVDHFIVPAAKQNRCRVCKTNTTKSCSKCNVNVHEACFIDYHIKH